MYISAAALRLPYFLHRIQKNVDKSVRTMYNKVEWSGGKAAYFQEGKRKK